MQFNLFKGTIALVWSLGEAPSELVKSVVTYPFSLKFKQLDFEILTYRFFFHTLHLNLLRLACICILGKAYNLPYLNYAFISTKRFKGWLHLTPNQFKSFFTWPDSSNNGRLIHVAKSVSGWEWTPWHVQLFRFPLDIHVGTMRFSFYTDSIQPALPGWGCFRESTVYRIKNY